MKERNLCHEAGCPDLCCVNKGLAVTKEELERVFPDAFYVPYDFDLRYVCRDVYVLGGADKNGNYHVFIAGRCPHNTDGCSAPMKPRTCKIHNFAGEDCNDFRREAGLRKIGLDGEGNIYYLPTMVEKIAGLLRVL
jgi:hypothetical protein